MAKVKPKSQRRPTAAKRGATRKAAVTPHRIAGALHRLLWHEQTMARARGISDCLCMFKSRQGEREYETGTCPHQVGAALLRDIQRG